MGLYEYLVCFALYLVAFVFLFRTYSELISLLMIAAIHFAFMSISFKDLYTWYKTLTGKKTAFLKLVLFIITTTYLINFVALVLIVVALFYLKSVYNNFRGTELYLSPKNRIILNYFEYIYISFIGIFYLLFSISAYSPEVLGLNVLLNGDKTTNIIFSIIFLLILCVSFYQLYNGLTFIKLKQQLIIGQEGFEFGSFPTPYDDSSFPTMRIRDISFPTSSFHNIDVKKIQADATNKANQNQIEAERQIDSLMNPTTPPPNNAIQPYNTNGPSNTSVPSKKNIPSNTNRHSKHTGHKQGKITNNNNIYRPSHTPIKTTQPPKPTQMFKYLFV